MFGGKIGLPICRNCGFPFLLMLRSQANINHMDFKHKPNVWVIVNPTVLKHWKSWVMLKLFYNILIFKWGAGEQNRIISSFPGLNVPHKWDWRSWSCFRWLTWHLWQEQITASQSALGTLGPAGFVFIVINSDVQHLV